MTHPQSTEPHEMSKYFVCFHLLISFLISQNESVNIDQQHKIVSSLITHLDIKHYILIKEKSPFFINSDILKSIKGFFKDSIYGSFFTLSQLHRYLSDQLNYFPGFTRDKYMHIPKTIIFQYHNSHLHEFISTVFKVRKREKGQSHEFLSLIFDKKMRFFSHFNILHLHQTEMFLGEI